MNKMKMVQVGEYEYERYQELKSIMKVVVYCLFIVLILSFLLRQPWFPNTIGVALIVLTISGSIINIISRVYYNLRRNDRNYNKFEQTYGNEFNKIVIPENDKQSDGLGFGLFSCPKPKPSSDDKEEFQVMGGIQGATQSSNNFSYLN